MQDDKNLNFNDMIKNASIFVTGSGRNYLDCIKRAMEEEIERKSIEILMQKYDSMVQLATQGNALKDLFDCSVEIQEIPRDQTIEQLKKQIRYSKNPLEIKMLNKQLNKLYKETKRK